ncbi:hypothetical protein ACQCVP_03250 [Rossellomorea vietnamensis]|uniref:hypothetical protein n=1 Tax=Rossellomorea vietnamensis TaxID=218284 RepID=UPI003CE92E6A
MKKSNKEDEIISDFIFFPFLFSSITLIIYHVKIENVLKVLDWVHLLRHLAVIMFQRCLP